METAREESERLDEEVQEITRHVEELWPQVKEYFHSRLKEEPELARPLLEKEKKRREKFSSPPVTHEQTLAHRRGIIEVMRANLLFLHDLKAQMDASKQ